MTTVTNPPADALGDRLEDLRNLRPGAREYVDQHGPARRR